MRYSFFIYLLFSLGVQAQQSAPGFEIACPADDAFISDGEVFSLRLRSNQSVATSRFSVTYENTPDSVRWVVEEALDIWSHLLVSRIPIKIIVSYEELDARVLAVTGSEIVYKNFTNAPLREVWYPSALTNAISQEIHNPGKMDIVLKINSTINWKYDFNALGGVGKYDLLSVMLHEIAHGVGFMATFSKSGSKKVKWGIENLPFVYDKFIVNEEDIHLVNSRFFTNDSEELKYQVTQKEIYYQIDQGWYSSHYPQLHTPEDFNERGSLSHLSSTAYHPDFRDRLMFHSMSAGDRRHYPGDATLAILFQIGWNINGYEFKHDYPETAELNPLNLYPNPGEESVKLSLYGFDQDDMQPYQILDLYGKVLKTDVFDHSEITLDISMLAPGKYFVRYQQFTLPFIKL